MFSNIWSKGKYDIPFPLYDNKREIAGELPIVWGEHCVECAMPDCYGTCSMYVPRIDGRCQRFGNGTQRLEKDGKLVEGAHIEFKKWAKAEALLPARMLGVPAATLNRYCRAFNASGKAAERFSALFGEWHRHRPSRVMETVFTKRMTVKRWKQTLPLDGFLMIAYNHGEKKTIHTEVSNGSRLLFRRSAGLESGWNEVFYPMTLFRLDYGSDNRIRVYFDKAEGGELTFRTLNFVSFKSESSYASPAAKVKCVAWDLDNTLWDGVIGDIGPEAVALNARAVETVKELDKRGILQTIVSKNEFGVAWSKIQEAGLADYFLYPAINWGRKSQSLIAISKELNINIDTFAVIDDSKFEREEISRALPQVRAYDACDLDVLLTLPEFDVPVTEESPKRRLSYMTEARRRNIAASWGGDYDGFLKECRLKMIIRPLNTPEIKERCLELLQRSNQYNISQGRRDAAYIERIAGSPACAAWSFEVEDRYGSYGIVGFACVEKTKAVCRLTDFVMSCRVAQKKAERAFFDAVMPRLAEYSVFVVQLQKTERNKPLQKELKGMPFSITEETDSRIEFTYNNAGRRFAADNIYEVSFE